MRVEYDRQIFGLQRRGGITRYFTELILSLRQTEPDIEPVIAGGWASNEMLLEAGLADRRHALWGRRPLRWLRRWNRSHAPHPDLYHPTYYEETHLPRLRRRPMAVTVHDMIPEIEPRTFPRGNPHRAKEAYVRAASVILCVSKATATDLLRVYGPLDVPIVVTPLGVSKTFRPTGSANPEFPFLLFVGNRTGYKEYSVLAQALAVVRRSKPNLQLIAVGGGDWSDEETHLHRQLGIGAATHRFDASDRELAALYSSCLAFVFPSRLEGFGLPTIEAMACGAPTVLANASVHPEIGGDAALYFAPGDPTSLAAELGRLISDEELRVQLSLAGQQRAATFTWTRTAAATASAYRAVEPASR